MTQEIRYDELKVNDVIRFYGANLKITKIAKFSAPANEYYPNECSIYFDVEPADNEAVKILRGYSRGTYGGVGCLRACLVNRA